MGTFPPGADPFSRHPRCLVAGGVAAGTGR
eukprot:ctg_3695.g721